MWWREAFLQGDEEFLGTDGSFRPLGGQAPFRVLGAIIKGADQLHQQHQPLWSNMQESPITPASPVR